MTTAADTLRAEREADERRADALAAEQLPAALFRLGVHFERAKMRQPRDHRTMQRISYALDYLQAKHEEVSCNLLFMRGQNKLREARSFERVVSW